MCLFTLSECVHCIHIYFLNVESGLFSNAIKTLRLFLYVFMSIILYVFMRFFVFVCARVSARAGAWAFEGTEEKREGGVEKYLKVDVK